MTTYFHNSSIAWNSIGDQVVALSLGKERRIHEFSDVASVIWQNLNQKNSFEGLLDGILAAYDVDEEIAREDLKNFLEDLRNKGLIEVQEE